MDLLDDYRAALRRGFYSNTLRPDSGLEELADIDRDPEGYIDFLLDRTNGGSPHILPDGTEVEWIPGYRKWIWDDGFCGTIGLRWLPGTTELPSHVTGHIGYSVVPWKRGRGYATRALALILVEAREEGLPHVDLMTQQDNVASRRVIENNGGVYVSAAPAPAEGFGCDALYRIDLLGQ